MNATAAPATVTIDGREFRTRLIDGVLHVKDECGRCNGRGHMPHYAGIFAGECFECGRSGGKWVAYDTMVKRVADRAKRAAAAARKEAARLAKQADELAAWLAVQDADVIAGIRAAEYGILLGFADQIKFRPLSARQLEVATTIVRDNAVKAAAAKVENAVAVELGHFGTVGERVTVEVEIVKVREFDGDYGRRYLVNMKTAEGHALTTWNTGEFGYSAEAGQKLTVKATIKKHGEYRDVPQTELTRVKAA